VRLAHLIWTVNLLMRKPAANPSIGDAIAEQSLAAQAALLPPALGVFGVCLPVFVWAGSFAKDAPWMSASFAIFAVNWGAFYVVVQALKSGRIRDLAQRTRIHILCGLLWSGAVCQMAAFANQAGPARDTLLLMTVGAALICLFFSSPLLPALLIVGPLAMAGPLVALWSRPESFRLAQTAWGAFALGAMLSLILNQNLRRQFVLIAERDQLSRARADSLLEAERLAKSKSALLATLSNEIRNGLSGVSHVLAAATGHGGRSAPSRDQLCAALAATQDLMEVLNTTLDAQSAEADAIAVEIAPFDPLPIARELVLAARPQAATKGLELQLHIQPELERRTAGAALGDARRARQVLSNLIGNAVKYTLRGRIEVRIERGAEGALAMSVADTGPGLTTEEQQAAFRPFARVARTAAGVPGAGLGLSLSSHLAQLMGGRLNVKSAGGVGSCFTLTLPFDDTVPIETHEPASGFTLADQAAGGSLKVLVAGEDGLTTAALRTILEQLGHQVVQAQNGRRAVDLARAVSFDLIVLDERMPQLDGSGATSAIRRLPEPVAHAPIIAIIGGEGPDAAQCLDAGADAVMRKPPTLASVARAIAEAGGRDSPREAAA